ncbi:hypothetical protein [Xanthomonas fragariae]|uniref:hypothetical protein n=1 Tax=Xanthomonas fragariae TaxID=48664 RepID=UPI001ABDFC93|nr:hypothetical protein [Xanthomonas fragariae]UKR54319.1 hypothetical protein K4A87_19625 [Xanthomonas fragariae]
MTTEVSIPNMRWDLAALCDHVRRLFGDDQQRIVSNCIRSVVNRREFSRHHYNEAMQAIAAKIEGRPDYEVMAAMLGAYDKETGSSEDAWFIAYLNIVACVHNTRAVADNLVHLVYFATGMNLDNATRIEERAISWHKVKDKLLSPQLVEDLKNLHSHEDFRYLAALDNHCKHRGIVDVGFSVSEADAAHGMRINAFTYEGTNYPQRWVRPLLVAEYKRQETQIMLAGNNLNAYVAGLHSKMP